jgi:HEAT repeat protein
LTYQSFAADQPLGWTEPPEHAYGLFFFRLSDAGIWEFTNPYDSWIPSARAVNSIGDTALDRVISVLNDTISVPDSTRDQKTIALRYLQHSKSSASTVALRITLSNPDPALRARAAGALMQRGDGSGLEVVKRLFLPGPQPLPDNLEETIPNAMALGLRDPMFIPDLEELLDSSSKYMRRGVAAALMRTGSPRAINGLGKALGDSDSDVRYYAVVGLAEITAEQRWRPNMDEFKSDEGKYLSYWKERLSAPKVQASPTNQQ